MNHRIVASKFACKSRLLTQTVQNWNGFGKTSHQHCRRNLRSDSSTQFFKKDFPISTVEPCISLSAARPLHTAFLVPDPWLSFHKVAFSTAPSTTKRLQMRRKLPEEYSPEDISSFNSLEMPPEDEKMIQQLIEYKKINGDCHVPASNTKFSIQERKQLHVSEELASWIRKHRRRYQGLVSGTRKRMTKADQIRILVLESMGFMWSELEAQWQRNFNRLEAYKKKYETLEVNQTEFPQLWEWVERQHKAYSRGNLSDERRDLLLDLGIVFDRQDAAWWQFYDKLCKYIERFGNSLVPKRWDEDLSLGAWVGRQRKHFNAGDLSEERAKALEKVGFSIDVHGEKWMEYYEQLVVFYNKHGHTRVPVSEGALWHWVDRQRRKLRQQATENSQENEVDVDGKVSSLNRINFDWSIAEEEERARRLMDLTFSVDIQDERWLKNYEKLCNFKNRFGHFSITAKFPDSENLAAWVKHQRFLKKQGRLSPERVAAMDEIGFVWTGEGARWDKMYKELVRFHSEHGHTRIPTKHRELYWWTTQQRKALRGLAKRSGQNSRLLPSGNYERLCKLENLLSEE